jgi:uncharacterized protein YgbK (DUF1537 family)
VNYAILADDLSGAADTIAPFSRAGYKSVVTTYPEINQLELNQYDVIAVSTNSRDLSHKEGVEQVKKVCSYLNKIGITDVYKKIDSTWRGNIGGEIQIFMEALDLKLLIICTAFPGLDRVIKDGHLLVGGLPIDQTSFAQDPGFLLKDSYLPNALRTQTDLPVKHINLEIVEQGAKAITEELTKITSKERTLVLVDAVTDDHLLDIASIDRSVLPKLSFCGAAALNSAILEVNFNVSYTSKLSEVSYASTSPNASTAVKASTVPPVLIINGSVHPKNIELTNQVIDNNMAEDIYIDPLVLIIGQPPREIAEKIKSLLNENVDVVLRMYRSSEDKDKVIKYCRENNLSIVNGAQAISEGLQNIIEKHLKDVNLSGLIVTGGNTAVHTLRGFGGAGIKICGEFEKGIPLGRIIRGFQDGTSIITKAGGFGSSDTFIRGIQYLQSKYLRS